jgi:hypothetical protein
MYHPQYMLACRYDPKRRIATLDIHWESRANALQRKGRAGRVQEGQCYSLYTRHRCVQGGCKPAGSQDATACLTMSLMGMSCSGMWAMPVSLLIQHTRHACLSSTCLPLPPPSRFEDVLRPYQQPEIQRVPLEQMVLQVHVLGLGPASSFLQRTLDPPSHTAVAAAIRTLREVSHISWPLGVTSAPGQASCPSLHGP